MEVLGVDDGVERLAVTPLDLAGRHQAREDRIAELGNNDQVLNGSARGAGLLVLLRREVRHALTASDSTNPTHPPKAATGSRGFFAAGGQEPDLVAPSHRAARKFHRLGDVPLEVEPERTPPGKRVHFPL